MPRPVQESRRQAREAAVQMLYQWEIGQLSMPRIRETFWDGSGADGVASEEVRAFALELAEGVVANVAQLDPMIVEATEHWRLERMNVLDRLILRLATYEPLTSFVLPGGSPLAAALHVARTVTRRAERITVQLAAAEPDTTPEAVRYLNRLSDLLFVLSRVANGNGTKDVLWVPGNYGDLKKT
jgi:hypothetical protein